MVPISTPENCKNSRIERRAFTENFSQTKGRKCVTNALMVTYLCGMGVPFDILQLVKLEVNIFKNKSVQYLIFYNTILTFSSLPHNPEF